MKELFLTPAVAVFASSTVSAHEYDHMMGWGYGMGWWGGIAMFLFWIAVIVAIVFAARWIGSEGRKGGQGPPETPMDVLKKRYARGEISKEEYERIKKDISS